MGQLRNSVEQMLDSELRDDERVSWILVECDECGAHAQCGTTEAADAWATEHVILSGHTTFSADVTAVVEHRTFTLDTEIEPDTS